MVAAGSPSPSVPITMARRGSLTSTGSSIDTDLSVSAIATVLNPSSPSDCTGASSHVHGTRKTEPIDTRTARRLSGSHELEVSSTASMPSAAAERKIDPTLVASTTLSTTTTLLAPRHTYATVGVSLRRMAQSTPRVSV